MLVGTPRSVAYRSDIDGLRAIAVLAVVFYHLRATVTPGGFVGVDIFFVISGYLITGIISTQMHAGTYSIADFYHRRARRIFPALFFVFACTIGLSLIFILPSDMKDVEHSLLAATFFVSNIYFYETIDYFAQNSNTLPFLHTWSLAVEEQFYIFFPLILLLAKRLARPSEKTVIIGLALISLGISTWLTSADHDAAFYLLQSRAWELMVGSLLAVDAIPLVRDRLKNEVLGGLGFVLLVGTIIFYRDYNPFPGLAAIPPCLGAALIIHSGRQSQTWTARLLSLWPLRFVGLISYSLYLWHWPIDVMAQYIVIGNFGRTDKIVILALSFLCAIFSWQFIEKPFRHPPFRLNRNQILGLSAGVMAILAAVSFVIMPVSERVWNLPQNVQQILKVRSERAVSHPASSDHTCFTLDHSDSFSRFDQTACLSLATDKPNYLLIGDSHADHLWVGLSKAFPKANIMQATGAGCKPVDAQKGPNRCDDLMRFMFRDFIPNHHFDAIIFSARWRDSDLPDLKSTIDHVQDRATRIFVMGPIVEYKMPVPLLLAMSMVKDKPSYVEGNKVPEQQQTDALFASAFGGSKIGYFSVYQAMCPDNHCKTLADDGLPLQFDYGHLTERGSVYIGRQIKAASLF